MAEVLKDYTFGKRGRRPIYPWEDWLDGQTWRIERGVDFEAKTSSMRNIVYSRASRMGMRVRMNAMDDVLVFRAEEVEA